MQVNLYLDCDKLSPDFSVVCYFGESVPETNLTYNDSASTISVTLVGTVTGKKKCKEIARHS